MIAVPTLEKAKDYTDLIPIKKQTADGRTVTFWVHPGEKKQTEIFDMHSLDKQHEGKERGFHDKHDEDMDKHLIQPLIAHFKMIDEGLAKRIASKYQNYVFDRETKELDIELDYDTARYLQTKDRDPDRAEELSQEYHKNTDKLAKIINNRKKKMLRLDKGMKIKMGGKDAVISDFSPRGFPIVKRGNKESPMFYEELAS